MDLSASPSLCNNFFTGNFDILPEFELPENFLMDYGFEEDPVSQSIVTEKGTGSGGTNDSNNSEASKNSDIKVKNGAERSKLEGGNFRVAFRTKSDVEVLDDGYKWRKYGKKMVKSNTHPRNYYKCLSGGCYVKKRIERDPDDSSYVITTYEGKHYHESPPWPNSYLHPTPSTSN